VPPRRLLGPDKRSTSRFLARVLSGAKPSSKRGFIEPCQPTVRDTAPSGARWLHEIKFDGYRVQAHLKDGRPTLFTRNGYDWTTRFARIAAAVGQLPVNEIVLDGEIIVQNKIGASDFGALKRDLEEGRQDRFIYYAFDLLHLDGFDIVASPLEERKRVLASLLNEAASSPIAYSEHLEIDGSEMFERVTTMGLEGIISKLRASPYRSGRSKSWLKIKRVQRETLTIVGFAAMTDKLASLHVARRSGKTLLYAGQVGTGFTVGGATELRKTLTPYIVDEPPISVPVTTARDRWVRPMFEAEAEYREITDDRLLRHAAFKGLKEQKKKPRARETGNGEPRRPTPKRSSRPLLVIDGDSLAHRAYHALPKSIRTSGNRGGGAIVGFANYLVRLHETERPRAVFVGWDTLDAPTWRHEALAAYQGGREFDDELLDQLERLPQLVSACGFANAKATGYEADDFLAAAVASEERRGGTVVVASGDRDAFQLASPSTTILFPVRAGQMARIGPPEVRERYGVNPAQVPDFIALRGDPSDKIPGAKGVGPQGAASLLRKYSSLEAALAAGSFANQAERLRLYRRIATMDASAPLPKLDDQKPNWKAAARLVRRWELNALADRLNKLAQSAS
jgi:DNA polymerase-1